MPFEPKLVRCEGPGLDDAAELDLPDDLALLAEQLRDDAAMLAARHPATPATVAVRAPTAWPDAAGRTRRRRKWIAMAASVAVAAVGAWAAVRLAPPRGRPDAATVKVDSSKRRPAEGAAPSVALSPRTDTPRQVASAEIAPPSVVLMEKPSSRVPAAPAVFVHDVTGPELEGVLDLLEHKEGDRVSLSF